MRQFHTVAFFVLLAPFSEGISIQKDLIVEKEEESRNAAIAAIDKLLASYVQEHKHGNVDHKKKFILGVYGCPRQFGNRMHEFMNDFALAVILGRNLVWDYTRQASGIHAVGTLEECDSVLKRKNWIPHVNITKGIAVSNFNVKEPSKLGCMDWGSLEDDVISPGRMDMYQSSALALEGSMLRGKMAQRARILFALGQEIAFGKLFNAAFAFEEKMVNRPTFKTLRQAHLIDAEGDRTDPSSVWVALHLRHKSLAIDNEERRSFVNVSFTEAKQYLPKKNGSCAVLFATDDEVSESYLRPLVDEHGCVLVRSDLGEEDTSWSGEHGAHTGIGALREIRLLSQADIFIGTAWSSFTQTIAEQVLAKSPTTPFWQCQRNCGCGSSRMSFPKPEGPLHCGKQRGEEAVAELDESQVVLRVLGSDDTREKKQGRALKRIDALIDDYIMNHRSPQYDRGNRFIAGVYGCPKQFGNRMHEFVNSFAIGLITGRNIAWEYTKQATGSFGVGTLEECDALMNRRLWIPKYEDVVTTVNALEMRSAEELACLANDSSEVIRTHRFEEYQALALTLPGSDLTSDQQSRARQLFALGPEVAYGKLLRAAFRFDHEQVVKPTHFVLRGMGLLDDDNQRVEEDSTWVAVHLRHQQEKLNEAGRREFAELVWNQTQSFLKSAGAGYGQRPCAVLLATDDERTDRIMRPWIEKECVLVRSDLGPVETSWSGEHGQHTGLGALRDVYLLSLADMVVGTGWSSFTQVIAELVLSRTPSAPFAQCNRKFCITEKTAFPRPTSANQCR